MGPTPILFKHMLTVIFKTFGCKLNQTETASLVGAFRDRGYAVTTNPEVADVVVLNTCTVTHRSDAKCNRAIRHYIKINSNITVVVVGCYGQIANQAIASIPGVDYVLGTSDKFRLFEHFTGVGKLSHPKIIISPIGNLKDVHSTPGQFLNQTRSFLKIQDGCDNHCTYCIVPFARGPGRSVPPGDVVRHVKHLIERGFKEIVLTGVHIGMYGKGSDEDDALSSLLERLLAIDGYFRIRLSSLDPEDVTDHLLYVMCRDSRICRHFHIPLQSGCDIILNKMQRKYTTGDYRRKVEKIISIFGNVGLGTDIIVGFPGESDALFEQTYRFVEEIPFTYLHVFPFSPRKKTKAISMPNKVDVKVIMRRAKQLRELGQIKKNEFMQRWIDKKVEVLMESQKRGGWMSGLTSEYLRVEIPYREELINKMVTAKINKQMLSCVRGQIVSTLK